jgi:translocation and assembly module TamA
VLAPSAPVVGDIEIEGNELLSDREIAATMLTRESGWWPFARVHRFDPVKWLADLERIERLYEARGHYGARVDGRTAARGEGRVDLAVTVHEGEPTRIEMVSIAGLEALGEEDRAAVLRDLPIGPGEVFRHADWARAKEEILRRLVARGHAKAALEGEAKVDLVRRQVSLELAVRPGALYRFGEIRTEISRGARVPPALIEEQVELALGRHRVFSEAALEEARRRLLGMGVWSSVDVRAGEADAATGRIPVLVEVREAPFHTLRLGGGMGIDQVRQEARLLAGGTDRDFLGGLRRLGAEVTVGWAFVPGLELALVGRSTVVPKHGAVFRTAVGFQQPRLLGRPSLRGEALVEGERTLEPAFEALGGRALAGVSWRPYARLTLFPSYNVQGYRLVGPRTASAGAAPLALGCEADPCFILASFAEQIASWDLRDNPLEPRRGFYLSISVQEGGGPLGGDFDYLRILPEGRAYLTFGDEGATTLAGRLRFGTLVPGSGRPEDSPVTARFYAGGPNSMRGFGLRRLSPMLLVPAPSGPPEARVVLPIGGNGLVEGSVEARFRVGASLLVAGFVDFGSVTVDRFPLRQPERILWAVGAGLRYLSLVGPIRVDLGVRLPLGRPPPLFDPDGREITYRRLPGGAVEPGRETGAHVDRSCFGIGGSGGSSWVEEGLCSFHISIGEAF